LSPGPRFFIAYAEFVEKYTPRQLSFSNDTIKAISGIMQTFQGKINKQPTNFLYGVPEAPLESALCWYGDRPDMERRTFFPS
jgi:hypothetical protein